jgi:hypothetical protein
MTTAPEVPLSAEEIAQLESDLAKVVQPERILLRLLATIRKARKRGDVLDEALRELSRTSDSRIGALESQLRDANRRASELFDELVATQNAAQAERVVLKAKLAHVQERRELAVAELIRQREALEAKLREAERRAPYEQHLPACSVKWCTACAGPLPCPFRAGSLPMFGRSGTGVHVGSSPTCNCGLGALQSAQKEPSK